MADVSDFFLRKKPWSKYKDLILDYYLGPYLSKVATLKSGKTGRQIPILIVDCFAGPGKFDDSEPGSPLVILNRIQELRNRGVSARGIFIERRPDLFNRLVQSVSAFGESALPLQGDFRDHVQELSQLAKSNTVFVYVDPIRPGDLLFDDLRSVYEHVRLGQSVETLVNFMSVGFLRRALGCKQRASTSRGLDKHHPDVLACNAIAGGTYWQSVLEGPCASHGQECDLIAEGYSTQLQKWFDWTLRYAVRERYSAKIPKYHLLFGSRHPDAIDLMNRAMVKARREFVGANFVDGMLFPNQPLQELIDPERIVQALVTEALRNGKMSWKLLRVRTTMANPCSFTDTEINSAIKQAIQSGRLSSDADGTKKQEDALVWAS